MLHEILTKDELKEVYGDRYPEYVRKMECGEDFPFEEPLTARANEIKTAPAKSVHWGTGVVKPSTLINRCETKSTTLKCLRKKLFNEPPPAKRNTQSVKNKSECVVVPSTSRRSFKDKHKPKVNRKSTSLIDLSVLEKDKNFKFKKPFHSPNKESDRTCNENHSFLELEKKCNIGNKEKKDLLTQIERILSDRQRDFTELKQNFETFSKTYVSNINRVRELLSEFSDDDSVQQSTKKTVAENIPPSVNIPEDQGLEKAVNMYNTLRKNYSALLSTPLLNRANLQTPKSAVQRNALSRRLQKQCLVLVDTPPK